MTATAPLPEIAARWWRWWVNAGRSDEDSIRVHLLMFACNCVRHEVKVDFLPVYILNKLLLNIERRVGVIMHERREEIAWAMSEKKGTGDPQ